MDIPSGTCTHARHDNVFCQVSYDKIAVRYRRWRNALAAGDVEGAAEQAAKGAQVTAGEMFGLEGPLDDEEGCNVDSMDCGVY